MSIPKRRAAGSSCWLLLGLFAILSLYDLLAPPVTPTGWRQTQTAMLTENFVRSGFRISGLTADMYGDRDPLMVYEFPVYNAIVGVLYRMFGHLMLCGKIVSFLAAAATLVLVMALTRSRYGEAVAVRAGLLFVLSPVGMLVRTSFQPDALGVLCATAAVAFLLAWQRERRWSRFLGGLLSLLVAGLLKYPILVPFAPLLAWIYLVDDGRFRMPRPGEIGAALVFLVLPLAAWYLFALKASQGSGVGFNENATQMFLIGDLGRFLRPGFYVKPAFNIGFYLFAGMGVFWLLAGIWRGKTGEWMLLASLPIFALVIPTSVVQGYYLYALTPLMAPLVARGWMAMWGNATTHWTRAGTWLLVSGYLAVFMVASAYLLRHDPVFPRAAESVKAVTGPSSKVVSIALHDRVYVEAKDYPEMHFLSNRKGWNLPAGWQPDTEQVDRRLSELQAQGAAFVVVTWYSSDMEPWFAHFIPNHLRRDPGVDGKALFDHLARRHPVAAHGRNFGVLDLREIERSELRKK